MISFIITLTYMGNPVIFRFVNQNNAATDTFEVSALNDKSFPPFSMQFQHGAWKIVSDVPEQMLELEHKLSGMITTYMEEVKSSLHSSGRLFNIKTITKQIRPGI